MDSANIRLRGLQGQAALGFLGIVVLCAGCLSSPRSGARYSSATESQGANVIALISTAYVGEFGDTIGENTKSWSFDDGYKDVALVAHLPTRSEFLIYSQKFKQTEAGDATNALRKMVDRSLPGAVPIYVEGKPETLIQSVAAKGRENQKRPFDYLKLEYDAKRCASRRYSTNEEVSNVLYVTDFPRTRKSERRLFVAVAMIPKETSADDRKHLMETFDRFLREMIICE